MRLAPALTRSAAFSYKNVHSPRIISAFCIDTNNNINYEIGYHLSIWERACNPEGYSHWADLKTLHRRR